MKQFFVTMGGVFAGLVLFFVVVPVALLMMLGSALAPEPTPAKTVLELDLRGGMSDQQAADPIASLTGPSLSVTSVVLALHQAEKDGKVKALLVRLPEDGMEPAAADELAQAFRRFRKAGKTIYAHSQGFYAGGVITSTYGLAASADQLWMQPGAPFEAVGVSSEEIFFKRFFDRYGVKAEFEQRAQYKNAVNPYLFADYTPAHREAQLGWMQAVLDSTIAGVAADRKMDPAAVRTALYGGPYNAEGALEQKLVDKLGQPKEMEDALIEKVGEGAEIVEVSDYQGHGSGIASGGTIAVINIEGAIMTGEGIGSSPFGETTVYSDTVARAIYDAIEDDDVKAIVMRVSSPGGSDTASEEIAAAVRAARTAKKPVVVSMGTYAASGGYWISTGADYIVAQPSTLTGSIGVYGGKFSGGEGAARYGVDLREISVGGEFASINSIGHGFTPTQRAAYAAQIDKVYATFLQRVSDGRRMPVDRVREIAGGRVWTGVQAKQIGLVDRLGGLPDAIDEAKRLAKITGSVRLEMLPEPVSTFQALEQALGVSATGVKTLAAAGWLMGDPRAQAAIDRLAEERMRARGARVLAPRLVH